MRRFMSVLCAAAAVQLVPAEGKANSEIVAGYDARSSGMAYSGAAYADTAAAILHNPANLTDVKRLSVSVSFNPTLLQLQSQVFSADPSDTGMQRTTPFGFAPFGFLGVAYKGHPRVAFGAAALITDGSGVKFTNTPLSIYNNPAGGTTFGTVTAARLAYEVRIPVALKITDWLSVAGGYRMTFANQWGAFKKDGTIYLDSSSSGQNFSSAQAGIMIRPLPQLQIGLAYRSRTKIDLNGSTTLLAPTNVAVTTPSTSTYVVPHMFTAGVATRLLDQKLLLTGDFKYWMYQDAYANSRDHQDAMSGHLGFEYHITRNVPIRAGYFVGRSSTKDEAATPFTASPKLQMGGTLGTGAHFDIVDIDASVGYGEAGGKVVESILPGNYHSRLLAFGVSATIKI